MGCRFVVHDLIVQPKDLGDASRKISEVLLFTEQSIVYASKSYPSGSQQQRTNSLAALILLHYPAVIEKFNGIFVFAIFPHQ